jgi:hypothetical protein
MLPGVCGVPLRVENATQLGPVGSVPRAPAFARESRRMSRSAGTIGMIRSPANVFVCGPV